MNDDYGDSGAGVGGECVCKPAEVSSRTLRGGVDGIMPSGSVSHGYAILIGSVSSLVVGRMRRLWQSSLLQQLSLCTLLLLTVDVRIDARVGAAVQIMHAGLVQWRLLRDVRMGSC